MSGHQLVESEYLIHAILQQMGAHGGCLRWYRVPRLPFASSMAEPRAERAEGLLESKRPRPADVCSPGRQERAQPAIHGWNYIGFGIRRFESKSKAA